MFVEDGDVDNEPLRKETISWLDVGDRSCLIVSIFGFFFRNCTMDERLGFRFCLESAVAMLKRDTSIQRTK